MKLRRYLVTRSQHGFYESRSYWTLSGARRYRNKARQYGTTRLYWWAGNKWVEMS